MDRTQASRLVVAVLLLTVRCAASPAAKEAADPGVPLENTVWRLADIGGRPMIEHVYRRTSEARSVSSVIVATDDVRIAHG